MTLSTRFETKNQTRELGCATIDARPQAKRAVVARQGCRALLDKIKLRFPDQRAIAKHPDILCVAPVLEGLFARGF
jgi:hypothetical protein